MKIVIIYATNTGNTYLTAQIIRDMLSANHEVEMVNALEAKPENITSADLVVLGSSSWDWQGKEGHPIQSMIDYLESLDLNQIRDKKFVIFGCGDRDFKLFCGAIDRITDFVQAGGGRIIHDPLKLDKFYMDILHKIESVKSWAQDLNTQIDSH